MNATEASLTFGYGRERLRRVFSLLSEVRWKLPIDRQVDLNHPDIAGDEGVIDAAVVFFTGGRPTLMRVGGSQVRVQAEGYYAVIGV